MAAIDPELRADLVAAIREAMLGTNIYESVDVIVEILDHLCQNIGFAPEDGRVPETLRAAVIANRGEYGGSHRSVSVIEILKLLRRELQRERGRR